MPRLLASLLFLVATGVAFAQIARGGSIAFAEGPERREVSEPAELLESAGACELTVAIGVDRAGKVVSAEVDQKATSCTDPRLLEAAVRSAKERTFNVAQDAPAVQRGTIQWTFEEAVIEMPPVVYEMEHAPVVEDIMSYDQEPLVLDARFPGGEAALRTYIAKHRKYVADAAEAGIQGKVFVEFMVAADGSITDAVVQHSVHPSLDQEALRLVSAMPKWIPGRINGEATPMKRVLPIGFFLR